MNPPGRQGLVVASGRGRPALPLAGQPSVPPSELQPLEFAYIFGNTVACWFLSRKGRSVVDLYREEDVGWFFACHGGDSCCFHCEGHGRWVRLGRDSCSFYREKDSRCFLVYWGKISLAFGRRDDRRCFCISLGKIIVDTIVGNTKYVC